MPGPVVVTGAVATCPMGAAPSTLNFLPTPVILGKTQAGKIVDNAPIVNVPPFGVCMSLAYPPTAAATAAALGALTPMPCVPAPAGPWILGSASVFSKGIPTLDASGMLICSYGGVITIAFPGQVISICTT